jgi:E-phenylitaconyl-CoA hydratase/naphthyl-2-hydroxymethylsuccinyl-CoA hydratase
MRLGEGLVGRIELWQPLRDLHKPIVAAINGYCYGGGMELALASDLRIASTNASFAQSEVKIGSMVGAGGSINLLKAVPRAVAMRMLLTGQKMDATEAFRVGLVSDLVSPEELMPAAKALAEAICANAPLAVRATKMSANLGLSMAPDHALEVERLLWGILRNTEDRAEGRRAFQEKRPPSWKGA